MCGVFYCVMNVIYCATLLVIDCQMHFDYMTSKCYLYMTALCTINYCVVIATV